MKIHLFVPLFLLVALTLLAGVAGTSPVAGDPPIADPLPGALLAGTTTRVSRAFLIRDKATTREKTVRAE
jgi:hypothetical protein